jgi:plastocyanin
MRRLAGAIAAAVTGTLLFASSAHAGFGTIGVGDDFFDPSADIEASLNGAQFFWAWNDDVDNDHNVRQDSKLFNSGTPTDDPGAEFGSIELPAGKYHYYCEVHGSKDGGMDGNIEITPSADAPSPDFNPITWALDSSIRVGDRWEVQYKVNQGKWKVWKKNTADLGANFGENDKPVNFSQVKVYKVRVKTKLAAHPDRQSKFSPPVFFPEN